jgi:hypothetical protein
MIRTSRTGSFAPIIMYDFLILIRMGMRGHENDGVTLHFLQREDGASGTEE